ncbi:MAG TPA: glycosyltransferase family 2 protein [Candidatus Limnocylindrales bacterium]|nr:glycosyltransferase family 2 protein [Candidatus Limnocylindrales bacterium]
MSDRPVVSVLIPAWNAGRSIGGALDSVLVTTSAAVECVVVDDGSTDDTAALVEARAAADPRVRLVRAPANAGVSAARNLGLDAVRGTWLTFLDADDVLLPGGIEAMVEASGRAGTLAVVGQRVWTDGRVRWLSAAYDIPDIREPGQKSLVSHPGLLFYASTTGKLFHESTYQGLRFEGRVLGDQPWTVRALLRAGDAIEVIDHDVYEWRRPQSDGPSTITAAKRGSARLAAEAARVAVGALREVAEEAQARLPEPRDRDVVVAGYFERLVRSDLAGPVARALARGDQGADELFDAVAGFVDAAPAGLVARSRGVVEGLILEPLDHWIGAPAGVRSAYLGFLRRLVRGHPAVRAGVRGASVVGVGLGFLARHRPSASTHTAPGRFDALVTLLFALRLPVALLRRSRRRGRRIVGSAAIER